MLKPLMSEALGLMGQEIEVGSQLGGSQIYQQRPRLSPVVNMEDVAVPLTFPSLRVADQLVVASRGGTMSRVR